MLISIPFYDSLGTQISLQFKFNNSIVGLTHGELLTTCE